MSIDSEGEPGFLSEESDSDYRSDDATSTFSNFSNTEVSDFHVKAGWKKVLNTCLLAIRDGLRYVWIDTCEYIIFNVRYNFVRRNDAVI